MLHCELLSATKLEAESSLQGGLSLRELKPCNLSKVLSTDRQMQADIQQMEE